MAAKPIDPQIAEAIVAEWRTRRYSQQDLADRHSVSKGVVNKLCKGVAQDTDVIVTAGIQYQQGLAQHDDRNVTAITEVVNESVKRMEWLNEAALENVKQAMSAGCDNQNDYRARADTVLKAKEAVFGKQPDTIINNTNAQQTQFDASKLSTAALKEIISVKNAVKQ